MTAGSKSTTSAQAAPGDKSSVVVIDIGKKQKRKAIRQLRQGRGKLMPKIESAVKNVQEETGVKDALPVVIVIERKRRRRWGW